MTHFDAAEHIHHMIRDVWHDQPDTVVRLFQTLAQADPDLALVIKSVLDAEVQGNQ